MEHLSQKNPMANQTSTRLSIPFQSGNDHWIAPRSEQRKKGPKNMREKRQKKKEGYEKNLCTCILFFNSTYQGLGKKHVLRRPLWNGELNYIFLAAGLVGLVGVRIDAVLPRS